jgi:hypothetical protein
VGIEEQVPATPSDRDGASDSQPCVRSLRCRITARVVKDGGRQSPADGCGLASRITLARCTTPARSCMSWSPIAVPLLHPAHRTTRQPSPTQAPEPAFRASSDPSAYVPIGRAWRHSPGDVWCARSVRGLRAQIGGSVTSAASGLEEFDHVPRVMRYLAGARLPSGGRPGPPGGSGPLGGGPGARLRLGIGAGAPGLLRRRGSGATRLLLRIGAVRRSLLRA